MVKVVSITIHLIIVPRLLEGAILAWHSMDRSTAPKAAASIARLGGKFF